MVSLLGPSVPLSPVVTGHRGAGGPYFAAARAFLAAWSLRFDIVAPQRMQRTSPGSSPAGLVAVCWQSVVVVVMGTT